jgi:hypothetical protein
MNADSTDHELVTSSSFVSVFQPQNFGLIVWRLSCFSIGARQRPDFPMPNAGPWRPWSDDSLE